MTTKTAIMQMALDDKVQFAVSALEKAGQKVFVELVDTRTKDAKKWNEEPNYLGRFPPKYQLQFFTLDPNGG